MPPHLRGGVFVLHAGDDCGEAHRREQDVVAAQAEGREVLVRGADRGRLRLLALALAAALLLRLALGHVGAARERCERDSALRVRGGACACVCVCVCGWGVGSGWALRPPPGRGVRASARVARSGARPAVPGQVASTPWALYHKKTNRTGYSTYGDFGSAGGVSGTSNIAKWDGARPKRRTVPSVQSVLPSAAHEGSPTRRATVRESRPARRGPASPRDRGRSAETCHNARSGNSLRGRLQARSLGQLDRLNRYDLV